MDYPPVAIMLFTYRRFSTAVRTLGALRTHLSYSGRVHVHIADDGSPPLLDGTPHGEALMLEAAKWAASVSRTDSEQHGYGASYNRATQVTHEIAEILLPLEDDWELQRPLHLDPLVETLLGKYEVACIRMGYVGYTQELRGRFIPTPAGQMLLFDPLSPEPHVFAGHARLETRQFERSVGAWPEMVPAGATEFEVSHREAARRGVAWPLDVIKPSEGLFAHIGAEAYNTHQPGSES